MNVNEAFSNFCRFYPSHVQTTPTSIWKDGIRSTMDMHASRLSRKHVSLYNANTPNGMYFPAMGQREDAGALRAVFITWRRSRAHRNSASGAVAWM